MNKYFPVIFKAKEFEKDKEKRIKRMLYYYSGKKKIPGKIDYIDYITRNTACFKLDVTPQEFDNLLELKKTNIDEYNEKIVEIEERPKTTGLWTKNGLASEEELIEYRKKLKNMDIENQHFWDTIISFDSLKGFIDINKVNHPEKIYNAVKNRIKDIFKAKNIPEDKVEWSFAFHINTDNPHIHLNFFETEPTRKNNRFVHHYNIDEKVEYGSFKGKDVKEKFMNNIAMDLVMQNRNFEVSRINESRKDLTKYIHGSLKFKNNIIHNSNWVEAQETYYQITKSYKLILGEINQLDFVKNNKNRLGNEKRIFYKNLNKEQKNKVNLILDAILNNDEKAKELFSNYNNNLSEYQEIINEVNGNDKDYNRFKWISINGRDGLYERLGQKILDSAKRINDINEWRPINNQKLKDKVVDNLFWSFKKFFYKIDVFMSKAKKQTTHQIRGLKK